MILRQIENLKFISRERFPISAILTAHILHPSPRNLLGYVLSYIDTRLEENFRGHLVQCPHLTDNETEIKRGNVKCLRSHS